MAYTIKHDKKYWESKIGLPSKIENYFFYFYEYIDDLGFMLNAFDVLGDWEHKENFLKVLNNNFKKHGWDGDGEIQILWLPPFISLENKDTYGKMVFHVKQIEDGISWIAAPFQLPVDWLGPPLSEFNID